MGHPAVRNDTDFALEPLFLSNEVGRPVLVPVLKASFEIRGNQLVLAEEQLPVRRSPEHWGDPESTSTKHEAEIAWCKPATDVVLIAEAHAARTGDREVMVGARVGPVSRVARVLGERMWFKAFLGMSMTKPIPFERIPLRWENAFGGWDRSHEDPKKHKYEQRNPVGRGFRLGSSKRGETPLPNIEDPGDPLKRWGQTPAPVGFGFTGHHWKPRVGFAGTYGKKWEEQRKPLLPEDFDVRFFNGAAPGFVAPGHLRGDEPVRLEGVSASGAIGFELPGIAPPSFLLRPRRGEDERREGVLDTVVIDVPERRVLLSWRCAFTLVRGPADVRELAVSCAGRA